MTEDNPSLSADLAQGKRAISPEQKRHNETLKSEIIRQAGSIIDGWVNAEPEPAKLVYFSRSGHAAYTSTGPKQRRLPYEITARFDGAMPRAAFIYDEQSGSRTTISSYMDILATTLRKAVQSEYKDIIVRGAEADSKLNKFFQAHLDHENDVDFLKSLRIPPEVEQLTVETIHNPVTTPKVGFKDRELMIQFAPGLNEEECRREMALKAENLKSSLKQAVEQYFEEACGRKASHAMVRDSFTPGG